jgi:hypothetical protein
MNNTFCISFSDINFQLLHVSFENDALSIHSAQIFPFPSIKSLDQLLSQENINFISGLLNRYKEKTGLTNFSISFVLPFNYAEVKKILLPLDSNNDLKRQQIKWELKTTLGENINNYKISILNELKQDTYLQAFVVAIKKEIINKLQIIAQQNMADINNVILNCFSLEKFLTSQTDFKLNTNYVFLKIDGNYLEYHFFKGNKYLLSQIDLLDSNSRTREELIVEITNERYKNIFNLLDKESANNPLELKIYGSTVTQEISEALQKGISSRVSYATIQNFPSADSYKFIESWGSLL